MLNYIRYLFSPKAPSREEYQKNIEKEHARIRQRWVTFYMQYFQECEKEFLKALKEGKDIFGHTRSFECSDLYSREDQTICELFAVSYPDYKVSISSSRGGNSWFKIE